MVGTQRGCFLTHMCVCVIGFWFHSQLFPCIKLITTDVHGKTYGVARVEIALYLYVSLCCKTLIDLSVMVKSLAYKPE